MTTALQSIHTDRLTDVFRLPGNVTAVCGNSDRLTNGEVTFHYTVGKECAFENTWIHEARFIDVTVGDAGTPTLVRDANDALTAPDELTGMFASTADAVQAFLDRYPFR